MKTIICPTCEQEHALYYLVHADGQRSLNYICNRQERWLSTDTVDAEGKPVAEKRYSTRVMVCPKFQAGLNIPVHWCPAFAKAQEKKQQSELISNDPRRTKQSRRA